MFTSSLILEAIDEYLGQEDCVYNLDDGDYEKFIEEHLMPILLPT